MDSLLILIPLVPSIMVRFLVWSKNQTKLAKLQPRETAESGAEKSAQYSSRVGDLEERVRVLERIVTDCGYDIATQIEALRDQRRVDEDGAGVPLGFGKAEKV